MEQNYESEQSEQQSKGIPSALTQASGKTVRQSMKRPTDPNARIVGKEYTGPKNFSNPTQSKGTSSAQKIAEMGTKVSGKNPTVAAGAKAAKATKAATTAGTALASGAATGGIGTVVTLALAGLKAINEKINSTIAEMGKPTNIEKEINPFLLFIIPVIILCFLMQIIVTPAAVAFYPLMTAFEKATEVGGELVNRGRVTFVRMTNQEKCKYFQELFGVEKYDVDLDRKVSEEMQIDENNIVIYQQMVDDAIYRCFAYYVRAYAINALNIHDDVTGTPEYALLLGLKSLSSLNPIYAVEEATEAFRSMRYPYTLAHKDGFYYTIGDYLDNNIPEDELNNDVNYAEIIAVISQNDEFQGESFSYSDMYDVLMGDKVASLLFEMKFYQSPVFIEELPEEAVTEAPEGNEETEEIEAIPTVGYYYPSEIAPYGLNELYEIADVNMKGMSNISETMLNIEILDDQEAWMRARCPDINLGPAWNEERPTTSLTAQYQKDMNEPVTGRSCLDYLNGESITEKIIKQEQIMYKNQEIVDMINAIAFTPTGESVILDFPIYINQGSYPDSIRGTDGKGDSIKKSGCIDCAYTMIEMYYSRNSLDMPAISAKYVKNNQFQPYQFMEDYGLTFSSPMFEAGNSATDQPFNLNIITASLTQGYPVVLHIKGHWEYDGRVYHQSENGHFLAIVGYDANGLYVYDPGSRNNTENGPIPYKAFNTVKYKVLRYVFPIDNEFVPWYRVNTIRDGKEDL